LVVPTLLEIQRAMRWSLLHGDGAVVAFILSDGLAPEARLNVYRNTAIDVLTTALRLAYPAVHRLVGGEFFEGVARIFIEEEPPRSAYLEGYGAAFPNFLAGFPRAAALPYLAGVARLEWAVNRALHAPDIEVFDLSHLSAVDPADYGRIVFATHPTIGLVHANHPVDAVWRAVLAQDDAAMATIDVGSGPVWLLVQRLETRVDVRRINEKEWQFAAQLCAGRPLQAALDATPDFDAATALAEHLAAGRFTGFKLEPA
jgi:putative DNA-binding protein